MGVSSYATCEQKNFKNKNKVKKKIPRQCCTYTARTNLLKDKILIFYLAEKCILTPIIVSNCAPFILLSHSVPGP